MQVNKHTAPELLRSWRSSSKAHPVDLYIKDKRVVHMRNWLCKVRMPCLRLSQTFLLVAILME